MTCMAEPGYQACSDYRPTGRIRAKFREVFGRECTLRDEVLLRQYALTAEGDLVLFVR